MSKKKIIQSAKMLYDLGFNVFPIPFTINEKGGKKVPYGRFSGLFTSRISRSYITRLFKGSNIAVICGKLSMNLFILDCDSEERFESVGKELKSRGIETWIVNSARGGHYWFLSREGEVKNAKPFEDLDVIGNRQYVAVPPSIHPTGVLYEWKWCESPLPAMITLDMLNFIPGLELVNNPLNNLPEKAHRVLIKNDISGYISNSEAEFAAVMSLAKAGFDDEEILDMFMKYKPPHFAGQRDPVAWAEKYMLDKAIAWTESDQISDEIYDWITSRPWPGRTGETDKWVMLALYYRRKLDKKPIFRASVRELSELVGVEKDTINKSLHRLEAAGYIRRVFKNEYHEAYMYKFTILLRVPLS